MEIKLKETREDDVYTDGSCFTQQGPGGYGFCVRNGDSWNECYGASTVTTNNREELKGVIKAVEYCIEHNIKIKVLYCDSKYVLDNLAGPVHQWARKNWKKSDGLPVKNVELWQQLLAVCEIYKTHMGSMFPRKWVKGHSNDEGNELADELARMGSVLASSGMEAEFIERTKDSTNDVAKVDDKPAKKPKAKPVTRFINQPRLYFDTADVDRRSVDGRYIYYTGLHGKEESYVGKRSSESLQSVVFLKEPAKGLEVVMDKHRTLRSGTLSAFAISRIDKVTSSKFYPNVLNAGPYDIIPSPNGKGTIFKCGQVLTEDLDPPILAYSCKQDFLNLESLLERYLDGSAVLTKTDLTDVFYEEYEKGPKKVISTRLRPEIDASTKSVDVKIKTPDDNNDEIPLGIGHISPPRNALVGLAGDKPTITLVTWTSGEVAYRYAVIIETEDNIGIWTSVHSNIRFIK